MTDPSPIWHAITGAALVLAGAIIGAWLTHRAATNQSPMPSLPRMIRSGDDDNGKEPEKPPHMRL